MGEAGPGAGRRVLAAGVLAAMLFGFVYVASREAPAPPGDTIAAVTPGAPAPAGPEVAMAPPTSGEAPGSPPSVAEALAAGPAPSFDVVRVQPDGSALVAGRAAPGAIVTILADDAPLAEAEADAEGNFVAIFRAAPAAGPQALTLEAETEGGTAGSEAVVMLLPEAPGEPEPSAAAVAATEDAAGAEAAPAAVGAAEPASAGQPELAGTEPTVPVEPTVAATAIVGPEGVEAVPTGAAGAARDVTLASIAYAAAGDVTLAGVGTAGSVLRVYVDESFAREAAVAADGRWSMQLGDLEAGVYRLRIDQIGADGEVASRVETPFQRDYPRAPVPRPGAAKAGTVTVQPGHNLWTLARTHYGRGVLYAQIFTANRDLIRDPDLIYPGQIFAMPDMAAE